MEEQKNNQQEQVVQQPFQIDPIEAVIAAFSIATAIGGSAVIGACIGGLDLSKIGGLGKIFLPLGTAGLAVAGGYAAGDAMNRKVHNMMFVGQIGADFAMAKMKEAGVTLPEVKPVGQLDN